MGRVRRGVRLVGRLLLWRVIRCRGGLRMKRVGWEGGKKWLGYGWTEGMVGMGRRGIANGCV